MALKSMTANVVCSRSTSTWERALAATLSVPLMCRISDVNWTM